VHLSDRAPTRGFDTALDHLSCFVRIQAFRCMIWLSCAVCRLIVDELNAAPVNHEQPAVASAQHDEGSPAGVSLQAERDSHFLNLKSI
jgi:hypothetical protein